jgi:hypothetical protein
LSSPVGKIIELTPFHHFFMEYGQLLGAWNTFELFIELIVKRELRLTHEETTIVCASLGFAAKVSIAKSLLNRTDAGSNTAAAIGAAHNIAERNGFAHGFISIDESEGVFTSVRRDVKDKLIVRTKPMKSTDMQKHGHAFYAEFNKAMNLAGITDADLIAYQRDIESLATVPQAQASPRPVSPPSFRSAKQERRHRLRAEAKAKKGQGRG